MKKAQRLIAVLAAALLVMTLAAPTLAADRDKDGLWDGFEKRYGLTDPNKRDTDGDGVIDSAEDNDRDGLGNLGEQRFRTNPKKRDTDGDGRSDAWEDYDRNGISNAKEQDRRKVPANLRPSLLIEDVPPLRDKCQAWNYEAVPTVCKFGPHGNKRVVLIGDSHAMMWSSPVKRVSKNKGWRFVTMMKSACPAMLGINPQGRYRLDKGVACRKWQRNVVERLNKYPPDLIIIVSSDRYALVDRKGNRYPKSQFPALWRQGVKRTMAALPKQSEVVIMGPVPHNYLSPRKCLRRNPDDMSQCVSPRTRASKRKIETALREAAAANGAHFRSLHGKICSYGPCPVVQGNKAMWRDKTHISDTFAIQLQPSVKSILVDALR